MMADDLESLNAILGVIDKLPPAKDREINFFNVGGSGYLENPTSDLMALFMGAEPGVPRWLGKALLECLMETTPDPEFNSADIDWQRVTAEREVCHADEVTETNKRLDIVFSDENFIVGIENKVYAGAENNPFHVYMDLLEDRGKSKVYKCVLRANDRSEDVSAGWPVVSYLKLVTKAKDLYGRDVASTPVSKWHFLYQELLAHLEQLGTQRKDMLMEKKEEEFVGNHYSSLFKVSSLLEEFSNHVLKRGKLAVSESLGLASICTRWATWDAGKVLRFLPDRWDGETQVALVLLNPDEGVDKIAKYGVRAYIDSKKVQNPTFEEIKKQFDAPDGTHPLLFSLRKIEHWPERKSEVLVLDFRPTEPGLDAAICGLSELANWVDSMASLEPT